MREEYQAKLRSRERGLVMGRGVETEESYLLPLLAEIERDGDEDEIYSILYTLFWTYCKYGVAKKTRDMLARLDAIEVHPGNDCSPLIAQDLFKCNLFPELIEGYIRRGETCIGKMRDCKQKRFESYLLKSLELAVLFTINPNSPRVNTLLEALEASGKGIRRYNDFLFTAMETLVPLGIANSQTRPLLKRLASSLCWTINSSQIYEDAGTARLEAIYKLYEQLSVA